MTTPFDRLMREALRAPAPPPSGGCLDAETLAAWSERTLDAGERETVEGHAAECARCQALLAAMIRIEPAVVARPWWRAPAFGWLAPLTVAAAALVIWVRLDQAPARQAASVPAQAPAAPASVPAPETARDQPREKPASAAVAESVEARRSESAPRRRVTATPPPASPPLLDRVGPPARDFAIGGTAAGANAAAPTPAPAPPARPQAGSTPTASAPVAAPAATAPIAETVVTQSRPTEARADVADSARLAAAGQRTAFLSSADQRELLIQTADGSTRWRVTIPGAVQRSTDAGLRWESQPTGERAVLLSGAAPSATVCWLVGRAGVVLLSSDGRSWRRVPFPEAADLVSVSAVDEKNATVTAASGRRFTTTDGGVSWR
jgi:hypothetical protein